MLERPAVGIAGLFATGGGIAVSTIDAIAAWFRLGAAVFAFMAGFLTFLWWLRKLAQQRGRARGND